MNRIDAKFEKLKQRGAKGFIPFVTAGDPDPETTRRLVRELDRRGASLVEIGVPYSDPLADGPTIQSSYTRALARGIKVNDILASVKDIRTQCELPILTMVSYSLVYRYGPERYINDAADAGCDGSIIPDLPVEEAHDLLEFARGRAYDLVLLVTPTTPADRRKVILKASQGFIYCVSVTGITGERAKLPEELSTYIKELKALTEKPLAVGFGVSTPAQARQVAGLADAVIVGSAIVRLIDECVREGADPVPRVGDYVEEMVKALTSA
jgi:tryptophan synthase alpha chain